MRVCRQCQLVNGDSEMCCRQCGTDLSTQLSLPPTTPLRRTTPDVLARRNRNALLLLGLLPLLVIVQVSFWLIAWPSLTRQTDAARQAQLHANQRAIVEALTACRHDTGGVPARHLEVLQQFGVNARDLTPGASTSKWRGPYLSAAQPFPANPYRPGAGAAGWRYHVRGTTGTITPAHLSP